MLVVILMLIFAFGFGIIMGIFFDIYEEMRPRLQALSPGDAEVKKKRKSTRLFKRIAFFNKPLTFGPLGKRISRDLAVAQIGLSAEEFFLIKELSIILLLAIAIPLGKPEYQVFLISFSFVLGYMIPEIWIKGKIKKVKTAIVRELPDIIDLLRLCVSAGLDFMLALKWIIEKSKSSILVNELNLVMQEINVGKHRRDALSDLAKRYDLPDLYTFSRTLIQADRMGTSVAEALEILSEDMRLSRYRRGEAMALKAPMKMLIPVLLFIFPVVGILVAAPILLDFLSTSTLKNLSTGIGIK